MSNTTNATVAIATTIPTTILTNTTLTTITSTAGTTQTGSTISSLISTLTSTSASTTTSLLTSTISANQSTFYQHCLQSHPVSTCRLGEFVRVVAYLFLGVALLPQIVYLFNHGSRYIAGISYMWIVIRVLGLSFLMIAHTFNWSSIFEFVAIISSLAIFVQIFLYADNLHRQQKIVLIGSSLLAWLIGGGIMLLLRNYENFLTITGYLLLSVHMLPQVRYKFTCFQKFLFLIEYSLFFFTNIDFAEFIITNCESIIKILHIILSNE